MGDALVLEIPQLLSSPYMGLGLAALETDRVLI
jgi:hypothetical protein